MIKKNELLKLVKYREKTEDKIEKEIDIKLILSEDANGERVVIDITDNRFNSVSLINVLSSYLDEGNYSKINLNEDLSKITFYL